MSGEAIPGGVFRFGERRTVALTALSALLYSASA